MKLFAKILKFARGQTIRLPKELRFDGTEVIARRFGNGVLLLPAEDPWLAMREALNEFEPGLELERDQPEVQARARLD